jgi:hypothetical protein
LKITKKINHIKLRQSAYDDLVTQIERISKALDHLHTNGVDIGEDGREQINHIRDVKSKFKPK